MIQSLCYVGFRSPAVAEWRSFGPEVLGAQLDPSADDAVALRFDDRAPRLRIETGASNELAWIGWDCGDAAGLAETAARLEAAGFGVSRDAALAKQREVADLVVFTDPFGFRHELTWGLASREPFSPGRPMQGFSIGVQGLGHLVFMVPDLAQGLAFYTEVLGFLRSDQIQTGVTIEFLHCNPRHHTIALSAVPGMVGVHHLMLEVNEVDDVGRALDIVNARGLPLAMTLGRHTNDLMTSFYVRTPSGFEIEYGAGGREIDDATWTVETYDAMSFWGHKPPAQPLRPELLRPFSAEQPA